MDTEQQGDSEGNLHLPSPSGHFFLITGSGSAGGAGVACREVPAEGLTFGRAASDLASDVAFDDPKMSRTHARIKRGTTSWMLLDLGSRNGSFVDGSPVTSSGSAALPDGAVVRMGDTVLVFRAAAPPPAPLGIASASAGAGEVIGTADRGAFPGVSAAAHGIRRRLAALAERPGHVLILGETGTGKERVARALAPRADAPFMVQNCAELTRDLARSELFGHLRGAFTGAHGNRIGLVEAAGDGVLFLDEVGELPIGVQGELLRFLEDGTYRPLGALELRKSRARIVAATNVDLDAAVRAGSFRRDLLARLRASNAPLELPPLRDRREDVAGWVREFTVEAVAQMSGPCGAGAPRRELWMPGALECLLLYSWPENLRELRGLVRELCTEDRTDYRTEHGAVRNDDPIGAEELPERVRIRRASLRACAPNTPPSGLPAIIQFAAAGSLPGVPATPIGALPAPPRRLAELPSREKIERVLTAANGNMKAAAESLSIDRRRLYRLCEALGIPFEVYRATSSQQQQEE